MKKVLVFTSAFYKRPYMMRQCIFSGMNQSYNNMIHSINITIDSDTKTKDFSPLYEDLSGKFIINKSENAKWGFSHFNNMNTIRFVPNWETYDIFIKMDDDEIYKKDYVKNIVEHFISYPDTDITSSQVTHQLNGYNLCTRGENIKYDNLGGNPKDTNYAIPSTFAFTKKALDVILPLTDADVCGHDDLMWRIAWQKAGLQHYLMDNSNNIIWHIHGENASVAYFLQK